MVTNDKIKFVFVGDIMLGGEYIPYAEKHKLNLLHPFKLVESNLSDADILFLNLEGSFFIGSEKRSDVTAILSNHSSVLKLLTNKKLCICNLANNHTMDYGKEGLKQTIRLLKQNNIYFAGAGENTQEANKSIIVELKSRRIAFLAYTTNEPSVNAILADEKNAGCGSFLNIGRVFNEIEELKKEGVDIICVSLHWGTEYFFFPSPNQVKVAHSMADVGANYIIGHHPHVVQGIEKYKNSLIMYSLGNFFMPPIRSTAGRIQPRKKISNEFIIVRSNISIKNEIRFNFIGGKLKRNYILSPFEKNYRRKFIDKIKRLSAPITSHRSYDKFYLNTKKIREKELIRESLINALRKFILMPKQELLETITLEDIKRNFGRLLNIISSNK